MAENKADWYHFGPLMNQNKSQPRSAFLYIPLWPEKFQEFVVNKCFDDHQLYDALFNGGQGKINAIYEYTSNKHLGVDEDDYDYDDITIQYSPIKLSFNFCYIIDEYLFDFHETKIPSCMFHTGEPTRFITHENAHILMNDVHTNTPNGFDFWIELLEHSTPYHASFIIGPYNGFDSELTNEIDTDFYFRWVEPTESENQTQERELHIRVIQERFPCLIPEYDKDPRNQTKIQCYAMKVIGPYLDPREWIFLGYNVVPSGLPKNAAIIFSYRGDYLSEFLDTFPRGRMKKRINGGLAIRVPNVYCKRNNLAEWTVLKGVQIKMLKKAGPETLNLECEFHMRRDSMCMDRSSNLMCVNPW